MFILSTSTHSWSNYKPLIGVVENSVSHARRLHCALGVEAKSHARPVWKRDKTFVTMRDLPCYSIRNHNQGLVFTDQGSEVSSQRPSRKQQRQPTFHLGWGWYRISLGSLGRDRPARDRGSLGGDPLRSNHTF